MTSTATCRESDASVHPSAGLENAGTNRATWIDFRDVSPWEKFESNSDWRYTNKRTYIKHLDHQNRGYANGKRRNKPFYTYQANLHLSQIFSDRLGLLEHQKTEAKRWFRRIDFQKLGHPIEVSAFAICARIVHETARDERKCHHQTPIERWPVEFREIYESWKNAYQNRLSKAYGAVDHQIRTWTIGVDEPASESMDRYGSYDAQLRHGSEGP